MANEDLFLRHHLGEVKGQSGGCWTSSPDIIPNGATPGDAKWLASEEGYNKEPPVDILLENANYIYVRGKNISDSIVTSRLWLYYAKGDVVLWPQSWGQDRITIDGKKEQNYVEVTADKNKIAISSPPFIWTPHKADHYCLVAFAETPPIDPPTPPKPNKEFSTWDELASFVLTHHNIAWRNTRAVNCQSPYWTKVEPITGSKNGGQFSLGFLCKNMPRDGKLQFSVAGPDGDQSIDTGVISITKPDMGLTDFVRWPGGYNSTTVIKFWKGATTPPEDASISIVVGYPKEKLMQSMPHLFEKDSPYHLTPFHRTFVYDSPGAHDGQQIDLLYIGTLEYNFNSVINEVPYWQKSDLIVGPPNGGVLSIGFMCRNMPTDGKLRLTVPGPNEDNSFDTGVISIKKPDMCQVYLLMWPPGFSSKAILNLWKGATTPPQGAEINIVVAYPKIN
jgi:hypothetical protein